VSVDTAAAAVLSPQEVKEAARRRVRARKARHRALEAALSVERADLHDAAREAWQVGATLDELMADLGCSRQVIHGITSQS
jgi:hypothetical protein